MGADYSDQVNFFDPETFGHPINLIGAGGIGSLLAAALTKLGVPELHIWDGDAVEPHNIPTQLPYRRVSDQAELKVKAFAAFAARQEVDTLVMPHDEHVTPDTPLDGVVISGVDSMAARVDIWKAVRENAFLIPLYFDGRIGGEELQLFTAVPSDDESCARYETWLYAFDDEGAAPLPCGGRTNIYTPWTLAGLITAQLAKFSREETTKESILFNLNTMQFAAYPEKG